MADALLDAPQRTCVAVESPHPLRARARSVR
jgi:hypothetical protein